MIPPDPRPSRNARLLGCLLAAGFLASACVGDGLAPTQLATSAQPSAAASAVSVAPSVTASSLTAELTPVPGGPTQSPVEPTGTPTQTDTAWGRIWDAVPASFPRVEASTPADSITGPVSAAFVVQAQAADVSETMKRLLDGEGYRTDQSGPLEDGSWVLDSTGTSAGCRVQATLAPQSGATLMTILFGAGCPFE